MDDLLHAFLGYDGRHCRAARCEAPGGARVCYALEADADPSLAELVRRMLPIWCARGRPVHPEFSDPTTTCNMQSSE